MNEVYLDKLAKKGLISVFRNTNYHWNKDGERDKKIQKDIVTKFPNILEGRIESLPLVTQSIILKKIVATRPDLFFQEYWAKYIDHLLGRVLDGKGVSKEKSDLIYKNSGIFFLAAKIKSELEEDFDWMKLFNYFIEAHNQHNYVGKELPKITDKVARENPEDFVKFMHNRKCVGYGRKIREHLHSITIKRGLLDKKVARRIRSDASANTSVNGANLLFNSLDLYPKATQQELILQFSDTRHSNVAYLMARRTPEDLLPFLVGLKDNYALQMLEGRLDDIADREDKVRLAAREAKNA